MGKIDTEEHPDVSRRTTVSNVTFIYRSLFSGLSLRPTKYFTKKKIHIFSFFFLFLVLITLLNKINFSLKIHIHPDHVNKLRLSNSESHAKLARKQVLSMWNKRLTFAKSINFLRIQSFFREDFKPSSFATLLRSLDMKNRFFRCRALFRDESRINVCSQFRFLLGAKSFSVVRLLFASFSLRHLVLHRTFASFPRLSTESTKKRFEQSESFSSV